MKAQQDRPAPTVKVHPLAKKANPLPPQRPCRELIPVFCSIATHAPALARRLRMLWARRRASPSSRTTRDRSVGLLCHNVGLDGTDGTRAVHFVSTGVSDVNR